MKIKYYSTDSFYKSKRWLKKRPRILRRDEYCCQECRRYGKTTLATVVHHIFPFELYPLLALVNENLISLCHKCHEQMHNRITNELTAKGIAWKKRVEKEIEKYFRDPPTLG